MPMISTCRTRKNRTRRKASGAVIQLTMTRIAAPAHANTRHDTRGNRGSRTFSLMRLLRSSHSPLRAYSAARVPLA